MSIPRYDSASAASSAFRMRSSPPGVELWAPHGPGQEQRNFDATATVDRPDYYTRQNLRNRSLTAVTETSPSHPGNMDGITTLTRATLTAAMSTAPENWIWIWFTFRDRVDPPVCRCRFRDHLPVIMFAV